MLIYTITFLVIINRKINSPYDLHILSCILRHAEYSHRKWTASQYSSKKFLRTADRNLKITRIPLTVLV